MILTGQRGNLPRQEGHTMRKWIVALGLGLAVFVSHPAVAAAGASWD